ncbi:MAG: hypothetical protein LJE92_02440 [Gammaproteobacteria bacterium]|nr:hypothetical protein [Gammaproteobacteria bacterium]
MRRNISGLLILLMILVTILNGFNLIGGGYLPLRVAGIASWLAALLLFIDTSRILKIQVSVILFIGIAMMLYAQSQAALVDPGRVISSNTGLMTMIAAVGFLRLVVIPDSLQEESLPVGPKAFLQTIIGLNISSSIINISAPILIADRIHRKRPLQRFSAQTFTRIFCGVSSWSPFFGAMAVVLTYVKGASLGWIIVAGFPFMLVGAIGVYYEARLRYPDEVENFVGYPTHLGALKIPALLIVTVVAMSQLFADIPILVLIALSALLVTSATLLARNGLTASFTRLREYSTEGLPRIVNELCLFLAAGVLAAGISALITNGVFDNPFSHFDAISAAEVLAIMVFCAFCGIHPIIMISGFAPMIMTLDPDPNLLAATFLFAWHLGTCSNPLSGTNLVFQGRYSIPGWKLAFWNWPYAIAMLLVGALWLQAVARIFP